ncbi:MAG: MFS transporter [archaeon]|nr:MFS transporter [archaeon]
MPFCMLLNSKIGIKKVMSFGILFLILYYHLLNSLGGGVPYYIIALAYGISIAFYYSAYHLEFAKFVDKKREATEISMIRIITIISTCLGPLIGAVFISKISFAFLFFLVSVLLVFSVIPLFFTKDVKIERPSLSLAQIIKSDTREKAIAYQVSGFLNVALGIFWPLFIFLIFKDLLTLGWIVSATSVIMVVFLFVIGKLSDRNKEKVLTVGIFSHSLSWISRLLFLSPIGIFLNNFYSSVSSSLIDIPFFKMIYEKAESGNAANYFLFREFNLEIGRSFVLVLAFFSGSIYTVFIISFFVTFFYFVLIKDAHLNKVFDFKVYRM